MRVSRNKFVAIATWLGFTLFCTQAFAAAAVTNVWEFQATAGDPNFGGGFDTASGGTDYSQGTSPNFDDGQPTLQLTDWATGGIGSTSISTATGGLTDAMIGNYIQLTGGSNLVQGFYRLTARADSNNGTIDRAADDGGAGVSGATGALGGALDILTDQFIEDADIFVPGNIVYIKDDGTMTLIGAVATVRDGTDAAPFTIEGYNTTRGDNPKGIDRPLIAQGANNISFDNFWSLKNLRMTATGTQAIAADISTLFLNIKCENSSGTPSRDAARPRLSGYVVGCEFSSINGIAMSMGISGSNGLVVINTSVHDSVIGIKCESVKYTFIGVVIDTCTTGIDTGGFDEIRFLNSIIYNCTTGFDGGLSANCGIFNTIIDSNTTGISFTADLPNNLLDFNLFNNNTSDVSNASKGDNSVSGNPNFTDAANGDFTVNGTSAALDVGMKPSADIGLVGTYKMNIGVDQDDNASGGTTIIIIED